MPAWDDFMGICDNYFDKLGRWDIPFGDFCWGQPRDPPRPEMLSALRGSLENGAKPDTPTDYFGYSFFQGGAQRAVAGMIERHRQLQAGGPIQSDYTFDRKLAKSCQTEKDASLNCLIGQ